MFSTRLRIPRRLPALRPLPAGRRLKHDVPRLPYDFSETGVPDLLSPHGFQLAWTMHMSSIVEKLNFLTEGTVLEDQHVKNILLATAREPEQAPLFNYASMAHNSHFFFSGLAPGGTPMSDALRLELEASFSSVDTLRREFVLTADAMFGPGFIWLVKAGPAEYRLLPTYLAGSPYPGAHWRAQPSDMNTLGNHGSAWDQRRCRRAAST
ncbi:hypothetical protein CDD83_1788 [Cordyceps sp. RAO-2017]|nr:hypothetical protein CDD83_1788 [Cordyceps sp. RAO-2017]